MIELLYFIVVLWRFKGCLQGIIVCMGTLLVLYRKLFVGHSTGFLGHYMGLYWVLLFILLFYRVVNEGMVGGWIKMLKQWDNKKESNRKI